jgi:hypothetical protein
MALTHQEAVRLKYLKRTYPKGHPQIAKLEAKQKGAGDVMTPGKRQPVPGNRIKGVVDPEAGVIDPVKADKVIDTAEKSDVTTNFNLEQPREIKDQYGNIRRISRDPVTGEVTVTDEAGGTAQKFKDLATAAAETFNGDVSRKRAEEATYKTLTSTFETDKARELEDAKQELANRGIPYNPAAASDPNTKDLYGKTLGAINQNYQQRKDEAQQKAILAGNSAYATDASARDSFLQAVMQGAGQFQGNFGQYNNTVKTGSAQNIKDILTMSAAQYMNKYKVDKDAYLSELAIAKRGSGGGDSSNSGGFEIAG